MKVEAFKQQIAHEVVSRGWRSPRWRLVKERGRWRIVCRFRRRLRDVPTELSIARFRIERDELALFVDVLRQLLGRARAAKR